LTEKRNDKDPFSTFEQPLQGFGSGVSHTAVDRQLDPTQ
jgi:hypothetical protein